MHPRTYNIWDVTPEMLRQLRIPQHGCEANFAIYSASSLYASTDEIEHAIVSQLTQRTLAAQTTNALGFNCPLFARKFPAETAELLPKLLAADHCHGLHILQPQVCRPFGLAAILT